MERCINGTTEPTSKGLNWLGRLFFMLNRFPPVRGNAPADAKVPTVVKIDKEEARNLIMKCRKRLNDVATKLDSSSQHHRIKHPRLGMLNARHWFKFILIHTRHHIKQLDRIAKQLEGLH